MKSDSFPKTLSGKWSVWLNALFLITIITSVLLVKVLGILSYDNHWWDVTAALIFPASIAAFILGLIAIRKDKEPSVFVRASVIIGILTILSILLHSLFIND